MIFALKGTILYSSPEKKTICRESAYVVCEDGICRGVYDSLPAQYAGIEVRDHGRSLILPGMSDLHMHAPQYAFRGVWMDEEVVDWLNSYTFPYEAKYADDAYAREAYQVFAKDLRNSLTTRACIFGTIHNSGTKILMEQLNATGLFTMVGRVNTDRNAPDCLIEESAEASIRDTESFVRETADAYPNCKPILTPRCTFFCSDPLMEGIRELMTRYELTAQSHLSENPRRLDMLKKLYPNDSCDGEAYDRFGLFGIDYPVVMAHCVHGPEEERQLLARRNVYVAHCPESNVNLSSGIAPIRKLYDMGAKIGLGSDIAAGANLSMLYVMGLAVQVSKMYWRYVDSSARPLTVEDVFYMATLGGGNFFGKVGTFEDGYEFDALVVSDDRIQSPIPFRSIERLERMMYLYSQVDLVEKYVRGVQIKLED